MTYQAKGINYEGTSQLLVVQFRSSEVGGFTFACFVRAKALDHDVHEVDEIKGHAVSRDPRL